jgi:hypothetical protein
MANASDGLDDTVKANLVAMFALMDQVRDLIGQPIHVHVAYRPEAYNKLIGGAPDSAHKALNGAAVDWDANVGLSTTGANCDQLRVILEPKLESMGLRMERRPGSNWVHLDNRALLPGGNRFFWP